MTNETLNDIKKRELKETNAKEEDGTVYGNIGGKVAYHVLGHYLFKNGLSLFKYIEKMENKIKDQSKVIENLRKAELLTNERLNALEGKLKKYGLE